jgi:hypothetical protein
MGNSRKPRAQNPAPAVDPAPVAHRADGPAPAEADGQPASDATLDGRMGGPVMPAADSSGPTADPFGLDRLRLSQDFASAVRVKPLVVTVPVRKPTTKGAFIRSHPEPGFRFETKLLEMDDGADRDSYLVDPGLWQALDGEKLFASFLLVTCMSRPGNVLYLMKIRLPGRDGRMSEWTRSALQSVEIAKTRWVRIVPRMELGGYQPDPAVSNFPDPAWPDLTFQEIIKIAFRDKIITDWDHPVLRQLRGEV